MPRPILINNWEATYFDFNREKLLDIAERAAQAGIELFVLYDGWFGHRDNDASSLGDWFENTEKLGGSICGLADAINQKGMKFGLWLEPEMISEDSELYRAHPDRAIHIQNREPLYSRNQFVLDYTRSDVREYIIFVIYYEDDLIIASGGILDTKAYYKTKLGTDVGKCGNWASMLKSAPGYFLMNSEFGKMLFYCVDYSNRGLFHEQAAGLCAD